MAASDAPCFGRDDMSIAARKARGAETLVSKSGPKHQPGARHACGRLKPVDQRDKGFSPAVVKRIVEDAKRGATDPRLGTVVGTLHLSGQITAVQLSAASRYARIRGRYDRVVDAPRRSALSIDYGAARGSSSEPLSDADVETAKRQHREMMGAIDAGVTEHWCAPDGKGGFKHVGSDAALASKAFRASRRVSLLDRVLVEDRPVEWAEMATLRAALDGLAAFWRIEA